MNFIGKCVLLLSLGLALSVTAAKADDSLYQDLGGKDVITRIAHDAVDNFVADERIKATFDNSNIERIKDKLSEQLCKVAGGPCAYTGHEMHAAHKGLHLQNADFNAVVEDLQAAMEKNGISFADQNRLLARLAPMQREIVTK